MLLYSAFPGGRLLGLSAVWGGCLGNLQRGWWLHSGQAGSAAATQLFLIIPFKGGTECWDKAHLCARASPRRVCLNISAALGGVWQEGEEAVVPTQTDRAPGPTAVSQGTPV